MQSIPGKARPRCITVRWMYSKIFLNKIRNDGKRTKLLGELEGLTAQRVLRAEFGDARQGNSDPRLVLSGADKAQILLIQVLTTKYNRMSSLPPNECTSAEKSRTRVPEKRTLSLERTQDASTQWTPTSKTSSSISPTRNSSI